MLIAEVEQALADSGLGLRGGFSTDGQLPPFDDGLPVRTVLMVGNAGPEMWERFAGGQSEERDPLDSWTRETLSRVAERFGARAVFPFQRPYLPFQQWLMRAATCHTSPLGIVIHPVYGLWHAIRGALLFADEIEIPAQPQAVSPCETCQGRPCLTTCPVAAFSEDGYDVPPCVSHLSSTAGEDCMTLGCRARRACPVGSAYRYSSAQARFHMEAFRRAMSGQSRED